MRVVITAMAMLLAACTASAPTARPTVTRGPIIGETSASPTRAASPTVAGRSLAPTASGVGGRSGNTEGCTPDFWKDHTKVWQEYTPNQTIGSVFTSAPAPHAAKTLLQGLQGGGGAGISGARDILLRAATASLLNASYDDADGHLRFPWRRFATGHNGEPPLISTVDAALTSGSRRTILQLAARLDAANNLGCPL
jgi:hypothetical protein